jgi:hypothetical protein
MRTSARRQASSSWSGRPDVKDITVFFFRDDITILYSLYPLLKCRGANRLRFTDDLDYLLGGDRNKNLLMLRFMKRSDVSDAPALFARLREKYRRIVYFDDTADPRELKAELLPFVDAYYKKQLLKDRSLYGQTAYGKRLYTDYYHRAYGIDDDNPALMLPITLEQARGLKLSWNLGIGNYPKTRLRKGLALRFVEALGPRAAKPFLIDPRSYKASKPTRNAISSRFGMNFDRNTVKFHRQLFIEESKKKPDIFLRDRVPLSEFNRELREVKGVLSPFGWGEVCFRDFEAVLNNSVLIKPSMDHVETWPDIYRPNQSYIKVDWDAKDLVDRSEAILADDARRTAMAACARDIFFDAYDSLQDRVDMLLGEFDR